MKNEKNSTAILLMYCPDAKGIVAEVTSFILKNNGNIVYLDQYVDRLKEVFFMRIEWELGDFSIRIEDFDAQFEKNIAQKFKMTWRQYLSDDNPQMAIFVSKIPHCLYDILARYESGEWKVKIPLIISNHPNLQSLANKFDVDFHYFKIDPSNKKAIEKEQLTLLKEHNISFIVLARYMQILTENFIQFYPNKIINIHHSFLPAFPGAKPYHSAYERGVKIIGATSHYVTTELDAGPIIEQDVVRVTHSDSVQDFVRKGRDLEKVVLSRAIRAHLERKLLVYENRTIVFV
jgi:formyltetrahydrofolate deformylase